MIIKNIPAFWSNCKIINSNISFSLGAHCGLKHEPELATRGDGRVDQLPGVHLNIIAIVLGVVDFCSLLFRVSAIGKFC